MIRHGYVDVAVTGGAEASINELAIAAFANMRALSTKNDSPVNASKPFDKDRDGFVMSEGAGVLVLESERHARERNGNIYGYIKGFGMSGDAYHISATEPTGEGAGVCIENCLKDAQTDPEKVDLINCHATGTPTGDKSELLAIKKAFGEHSGKPYVQSTKALIGHSLGAAGAIELIASILESKYSFIHGMPSLIEKDEQLEGIKVSTETISKDVKNVLKNSFGFGGHNVSVLYCSE
jgi:3-oxoacyl-[acyl-carrier-protein] synthase II